MKGTGTQQSTYALGDSEQELERLSRQAQAFEPFTRHLLHRPGSVRACAFSMLGVALETSHFWPPTEGDPAAMEFDRPFDAVVSRLVLITTQLRSMLSASWHGMFLMEA